MGMEQTAKWIAYFQLEPTAADRADARETHQRAMVFWHNLADEDRRNLPFEKVIAAFQPEWCEPPDEAEPDYSEMAEGCDPDEFRKAQQMIAGFQTMH